MRKLMVMCALATLVLSLSSCAGFRKDRLYLMTEINDHANFSGKTVADCERAYSPDNLYELSIAFMLVEEYPDYHEEKFVHGKAILLIPYTHQDGENREKEIRKAYGEMPLFFEGGKTPPEPSSTGTVTWGKYGKYIPLWDAGRYYDVAIIHEGDLWECPTYSDFTEEFRRGYLIVSKDETDITLNYYHKKQRTVDGDIMLDTWEEGYTKQEMGMFIMNYPHRRGAIATRQPVFYLLNDKAPERPPDSSEKIAEQ